jgi:hypothetical protein
MAQNSALSQTGSGNDGEQETNNDPSSNQDNQIVSGESSILSGNNVLCQNQDNVEFFNQNCDSVVDPEDERISHIYIDLLTNAKTLPVFTYTLSLYYGNEIDQHQYSTTALDGEIDLIVLRGFDKLQVEVNTDSKYLNMFAYGSGLEPITDPSKLPVNCSPPENNPNSCIVESVSMPYQKAVFGSFIFLN